MRMIVAQFIKPRVMEGNMSHFTPSYPLEGSHPKFKENSSISSMPSQNAGIDAINSAKITEKASITEYCFTADRMPINTAISIVKVVSCSVSGNLSLIISQTGMRS